MILWHDFTSDLEKASCAFGRFLWVAFLLAKYRSGGDGKSDYEYLSSNCCRIGDVSVWFTRSRFCCRILGSLLLLTNAAERAAEL
jgi:hypothetical protein